MGLQQDFEEAQRKVKMLSSMPDNSTLLELYALYKQGSEGDVRGSRPGMMDFKGRAKWDAWSSKKGTTKDAAMTAYVALVSRLAGA